MEKDKLVEENAWLTSRVKTLEQENQTLRDTMKCTHTVTVFVTYN